MNFYALQQQIRDCRDCAERFGFEPHPIVFGNQKAKVMQISQAPSQNVHLTGRPFDDLSGRRLRGAWYEITDAAFYNPDNFYIASIGHCYPGKNPGGGDRLPPAYCARKWLMREIEMVESEIILLLGGCAAKFFFPGRPFPELVFSDHMLFGRPAYVLPHPSPLNVRWFLQHPAFLEERMPTIRAALHRALGNCHLPPDMLS